MTLVLAQGSLLSPFLPLNKVVKMSSQGGDKTLDLLGLGGGRRGRGEVEGRLAALPRRRSLGKEEEAWILLKADPLSKKTSTTAGNVWVGLLKALHRTESMEERSIKIDSVIHPFVQFLSHGFANGPGWSGTLNSLTSASLVAPITDTMCC